MQDLLMELKEYEDLAQALSQGKGPLQATGTLDSQKVHLMNELGRPYPWKLVVTYDELRAKEIYDDFRNFTRQVWLYPAKDLLFYAADIHGNMMARQRIKVQKALMEEKGGVVITTPDGLMDHLLPLGQISAGVLSVEPGQQVDLEGLKEKLVALGYERMAQVDGMGQFSIRGGIIDIFPLTEEFPVRIELWDDEVDSVRCFDLESQRSVEQLEKVRIYPAKELVLDPGQIEGGIRRLRQEAEESREVFRKNGQIEEGHRIFTIIREFTENLEENGRAGNLDGYIRYFSNVTVSFAQYFSERDTLIFLDEPLRIQEKGEAVETEFRESMGQRLEKGYLLGGQTELLYPMKEVLARLQTGKTVYLTGLEQRLAGLTVNGQYAFTVKNVNSYQNGFELLIKDLTRWKKDGYRVVLLTGSRTRASRLASDLREYELRAYCPDGLVSIAEDKTGEEKGGQNAGDKADEFKAAICGVKPGEILVTYGNLHKGFEYPMLKFVVITEGDIFGGEKKKKGRRKSSYEGKKIAHFSEQAVGD